MDKEINSKPTSEVREHLAEYELRTKEIVQWKYDPRQRIPFEQIDAVARRIAERFPVEKILLFGSYAYGKPQEGSDVDLLVIMNHGEKSNRKQRLKISQSLYPRLFPLDILVRTPLDIKKRIAECDWMLKEAYEKGKILYERT